jgi:hypothetical protein
MSKKLKSMGSSMNDSWRCSKYDSCYKNVSAANGPVVGVWKALKVDIVESFLVGTSLTNICVSVLISTSYGVRLGYCGKGALSAILVELNMSCGRHGLKPKSRENWESIEPPLVLAIPSENWSDANETWHKLGGELVFRSVGWGAFSVSFVRLMMFLIFSFCCLRCSLLLHHIGRLYSHFNPRCLQALHPGFPSSHFFLRNLHVKHPVRERRCIFVGVCFELAEFGPDMFGDDLLEQGDFTSGITEIIVIQR